MDSSYCFVCGSKNPKSLGFKVFFENGIAKAYYSFAPEYQGWKEVIHGGLIATVLDEIMAYAASQIGHALTTHLNVTFRNVLHPNEKVLITGWIEEQTRRKAKTRAEMQRLSDNKLIASAEGISLFVRP